MSLEQELRRALRRKEPPSGFDDRVLSRIASGETVPVPEARSAWTRVYLPLAASLMLAAGAATYVQYQQYQQRVTQEQQANAERATRSVVLALQVASETVSAAQAARGLALVAAAPALTRVAQRRFPLVGTVAAPAVGAMLTRTLARVWPSTTGGPPPYVNTRS